MTNSAWFVIWLAPARVSGPGSSRHVSHSLVVAAGKVSVEQKKASSHWHGESVRRPTTGFLDSNRSLGWFWMTCSYWLHSYLTQRQRPASGSNPEKAGSKDKLALKQESTLGLTAEEVSQAGFVTARQLWLTMTLKKCFPVISEMNTDQDAAEDTGGAWETGGLH